MNAMENDDEPWFGVLELRSKLSMTSYFKFFTKFNLYKFCQISSKIKNNTGTLTI